MKKIILTGDRPTGPLHLGHFVGSLKNRLKLQGEYEQFIMIADMQALTDHADNPKMIKENILQVAADYLAVGIDPEKTTIFVQSTIPQLSELTMYFLNLVTFNRIKHNPTVKAEIKQKKFKDSVPAGFMIYPISQAADILCFDADLVPVGEDQMPMIEQTTEIVRKFNRTYSKVLKEPEALISKFSRLPGIDGKAKMSKSLNNAIYLSEEKESLIKKIKKMYTDPNHLRVEDPGVVEGNTVFFYLDAFAKDTKKVEDLKNHYRKGGLGDSVVKRYLEEVLIDFLEPINKKRKEIQKDQEYIYKILENGNKKAFEKASKTLEKVKKAMGLF